MSSPTGSKARPTNRALAFLYGLFVQPFVLAYQVAHTRMTEGLQEYRADTAGAFSLGSVQGLIMSIIGAVIAASIVAATASIFFTAIADTNAELDNASLNDSTADTVAGLFPIIVGVGAVIGLVGIVMAAIKFRNS